MSSVLRLFFACVLLASTIGVIRSGAEPQTAGSDAKLRELYDRGVDVYHFKKQHEAGMKLFLELEEMAKEYHSDQWEASALWKQAQYWDNEGNQTKATKLFEKSHMVNSRNPHFVGSPNELILLGNIFGMYRAQGQLAEAGRIHRKLVASTAVMLGRDGFKAAGKSLFDLTDSEMSAIQQMAYAGVAFECEIARRIECGDDAGALVLAEKVDRRYGDTRSPPEVTIYADVLEQLVEIHLSAGNTDAAEKVLERLLIVAKTPKAESYDELQAARINYSWLRFQKGDEPAPLFAEIDSAMTVLKRKHWIEREILGRCIIARMQARTGNFLEAKKLLDSSITQVRALDMPSSLATLLLTRAELSLDAGITNGVQEDLFAAARWYRQRGGLRAETGAYVQYVRFLRISGEVKKAAAALALAKLRLSRFPSADQAATLARESVALTALAAGNIDTVPGTGIIVVTDLQPVQVSTRVIDGWPTMGRFTLTNAGETTVTGSLEADASNGLLASKWDNGKLEWTVLAGLGNKALAAAASRADTSVATGQLVKQTVTLRPLEQATILVSLREQTNTGGTSGGSANRDNAPGASAANGRVKLYWRTGLNLQTAWWKFAPGVDDADIAVTDANLAVESPFYSVPLHHFIRRTDPTPELVQSLRVIASVPCRVELVDAASGKILAIDANGDGDFTGAGDMIFSDHDADGFPDIVFVKNEAAHAIEIQLYPSAGSSEILAKLELRNTDGSWSLRTTDRLVGKK